LGLIALLAVLLINTARFSSVQTEIDTISKIDIDESSIEHFSDSLKIKTISHEDAKHFDTEAFEEFNDLLKTSYPSVFSKLKHQTFNQYSHLFHWQGTDTTLKPIILMGHIDVVPIASPEQWSEAPFAGTIKNGFIWGRGTIDDKISVIASLEAITHLLKNDFKPKRSIYLAFGHDEEIGGELGAKAIANYLLEEGIEAEFVRLYWHC